MDWRKMLGTLLTVVVVLLPGNTAYAVSSESYTWKNVSIGGGGYVTGIVIHPSEPDLVYIRTDVGGAYRLDPNDSSWIPLMDGLGPEQSNLYGIDGIALDSQNPDIVYVSAGKTGSASPSDILKSTDRGNTWSRTNLNKRNEANGNVERAMGESIAVHPNLSNIVYAGTRYDGLYRSQDAGQTWSKVNEVPAGTSGKGIRSLIFGSVPGAANLETALYVGVMGIGIYETRGEGSTWNLIPGSPAHPARLAAGQDGSLYVTTPNNGVHRYKDGSWSNITPNAAYTSYYGIDIDPHNDSHLLAAVRTGGAQLPLYRSINRGESWTLVNKAQTSKPGWWQPNMFFSATSTVVFDPHHAGTVYSADWFGVYRTKDIGTLWTKWETLSNGHEEVVALTGAAPPEGAPLFTGVADVIGFRHMDVNASPAARLEMSSMREMVSVDYHEANPQYMAFIGSDDWYGTVTRMFVSSDNGLTMEARPVPAGSKLGRLAYSATDLNTILWFPQSGSPVRTTDRGATWEAMTGAPTGTVGGSMIFSYNHPIAADRVDGSKFYAYKSGYLHVSSDAGQSWSIANQTPLPGGSPVKVEAAPGMEGVLWISLGANGVYVSANSGASFTKLDQIKEARLFAFGKAAPGQTQPAAFLYGEVGGIKGIFRSDDRGSTWIQINSPQMQIGNEPQVMVADRQEYGKVYIGTNGRGFMAGTKD
ncbi:hypothetical protein [Paenibacillus sp. FSL H8-0537]|uniref:WD40/YVTN/BNR-like repeat-containing protein n=1 Tax=Paenibacillus sp. FSL H8-0537 TaxID=2921399 RepID=UPI003101091C